MLVALVKSHPFSYSSSSSVSRSSSTQLHPLHYLPQIEIISQETEGVKMSTGSVRHKVGAHGVSHLGVINLVAKEPESLVGELSGDQWAAVSSSDMIKEMPSRHTITDQN